MVCIVLFVFKDCVLFDFGWVKKGCVVLFVFNFVFFYRKYDDMMFKGEWYYKLMCYYILVYFYLKVYYENNLLVGWIL